MQIANKCILLMALVLSAFYAQSQIHKVYTGKEGRKSCEITIYDSGYVDVVPQFPGGDRAMMKFINETRRYPVEAYNNKVQGRVVCSFVVYPDGSINAISVIKGEVWSFGFILAQTKDKFKPKTKNKYRSVRTERNNDYESSMFRRNNVKTYPQSL